MDGIPGAGQVVIIVCTACRATWWSEEVDAALQHAKDEHGFEVPDSLEGLTPPAGTL